MADEAGHEAALCDPWHVAHGRRDGRAGFAEVEGRPGEARAAEAQRSSGPREGSTLLVESRRLVEAVPATRNIGNDKSLRRAIQPLIDDPMDNTAARGSALSARPATRRTTRSPTACTRYRSRTFPTAADFTITLDVISKECFGPGWVRHQLQANRGATTRCRHSIPPRSTRWSTTWPEGKSTATANLTVQEAPQSATATESRRPLGMEPRRVERHSHLCFRHELRTPRRLLCRKML